VGQAADARPSIALTAEFDTEGRRVRSTLITDPERIGQAKIWWQLAYTHSARIEDGEAA
jgi:hypothetical protein